MKKIQELNNQQRACIDELDAAIKESSEALGTGAFGGVLIGAVCAEQDRTINQFRQIYAEIQTARKAQSESRMSEAMVKFFNAVNPV